MRSYTVTLSNGRTFKVPASDQWLARQLAIRAHVAEGGRRAYVKGCTR